MSENWREGLCHKDWMFDGRPIRGEYLIDRFNHLDWSKAWVDLGPSVAGNLGPYWHVPMDDGDTTHRLYPKLLQSKWLMLIRKACEEYAAQRVKEQIGILTRGTPESIPVIETYRRDVR